MKEIKPQAASDDAWKEAVANAGSVAHLYHTGHGLLWWIAQEHARISAAQPSEQAQQPTSAPAEVERQYKDGVHIGSGLPRESCPCGLCKKYPAPADAPIGYLVVGKQSHGRFFTSKGMAEVEKANRDEGYGGEDEARIIPLCECATPSADTPKEEPVAVVSVHKSGIMTLYASAAALKDRPIDASDREIASKRGCELIEVYAAPVDAAAIRNAALEEAARACEAMDGSLVAKGHAEMSEAAIVASIGADKCAKVIRALKTDQQEKGE